MMLTHRGTLLFGIVLAALVSGLAFGARGLNGIAAPGVIALAAAAIQISRFEPPTIERVAPPSGHRGDTVPVELHLRTGTPYTAEIVEGASDGLDVDDPARTVAVSDTAVRYTVTLSGRGEQSLGPTTVIARDVLGLVAVTFEVDAPQPILVYPRVHDLKGPRKHDLARLYGGSGDDRQEFDQLRLYQRGDPMRDIHWKSSAKQPQQEFVVKQFGADSEVRTVEIAAEAADGRVDSMADAAASIALFLLDTGVSVGLTTPTGRVAPDRGPEHRTRLLRHLALAGAGAVAGESARQVDIRIRTAAGRVLVKLGHLRVPFTELSGHPIDDVPEERWRIRGQPPDPYSRLAEAT